MKDRQEFDSTPPIVRPFVWPARIFAAGVALCGLVTVGRLLAGADPLPASLLTVDWLPWEGEGMAPLPGVVAPYPIPVHDLPSSSQWYKPLDRAIQAVGIGFLLLLASATVVLARRRPVGVEPFAVVSALLAIVAIFGVHVFASRYQVDGGWYEPPFVRWRTAPIATLPLIGLLAAAVLFALTAVVRILRSPARTGWVIALCSLVGSTWGMYGLSLVTFAPNHLNRHHGAAVEGLPSIVNGYTTEERFGAELRIVLRSEADWALELYPKDSLQLGNPPPDQTWVAGSSEVSLLDAVAQATALQVASAGGAPGSPPDPESTTTILAVGAEVPFGAVRPVVARLVELGVEELLFEAAPLALGGNRSLSSRVYTSPRFDGDWGPDEAFTVRFEPPEAPGAPAPVVIAGRRFADMNAGCAEFDRTDVSIHVDADDQVPWRSIVHARDRTVCEFVLLDR
ncbi:MAG: hypothetical protein AAF726_22455 [Planctomycetota bacterium]